MQKCLISLSRLRIMTLIIMTTVTLFSSAESWAGGFGHVGGLDTTPSGTETSQDLDPETISFCYELLGGSYPSRASVPKNLQPKIETCYTAFRVIGESLLHP